MDERLRWSARRGSSSALLILEFGLARRLAEATLLHGSELSVQRLRDPHAEIEGWQELALLRNLVRALDAPASIGLELGARYHLTTHGMYGFLLLGCGTVRRALELGLRYLELTCAFTTITVEERDGTARLLLDDSAVPPDLQHVITNRDAAAVMTLRRQITGVPPGPRALWSRHPRPPDAERYSEFFGGRFEFERPFTGSTFLAAFLDAPLPQANEHTVQLCEADCRALLLRRRAARGVTASVRDVLLARPGVFPSLVEVARALAMSPRTLRRRLDEEGTNFRALMEELRLALAEELLVSRLLPLPEIAARLGYADLSGFLHAFKRMRGQSPSQFLAERALTDGRIAQSIVHSSQ